MTNALARAREWWACRPWLKPLLMATMGTFTVTALIMSFAALDRVGEQALAGEQARNRQCIVWPISEKLYRAAEGFDLLTPEDLWRWEWAGEPRNCPKVDVPDPPANLPDRKFRR